MKKTDPVLEIDYKNSGHDPTRRAEAGYLGRYRGSQEEFGVSYVTGVKLVVPATNEFGDPLADPAAFDRSAGQAPRHAPLSPCLSRLQIVGRQMHETALLSRP